MTAAALSFIGGGIGPIPGHGVNAAFPTFRAGAMSWQARGPGWIGFLVGAAAILFFCMFADLAAAYTLKSDEGNFTAEFKAEPRFSKLDESGGAYTRYQWLLDQGKAAWIVTYNDYKAGTLMNADQAKAYDRAVWGGVNAVKGKLQSHGPVTQAGLSGRESRVFIPRSNLIMRQRIFIKGDRLYQNIYVGPPGSEDGQDVETFFASFRLAH